MLRLLLILMAAFAPIHSRTFRLPANLNKSVFNLFSNYVQSNVKIYRTVDEYQYRFSIFVKNLAGMVGTKASVLDEKVSIEKKPSGSIIKLKQNNGACDFEMSLNEFFDLSEEEFKSYYLLPAKFFDPVKYNPISKIVKEIDGEDRLIEIDDNMDPFEELGELEKNTINRNNLKNKSFENIFYKQANDLKEDIIRELKDSLDAVKRKIDFTKMVEPADQGISQDCRTENNVRSSIANGALSNYNYSKFQTPSNLDFSHIFSERRLQAQLTLSDKYLQQDLEKDFDLGNVSIPGFLDWNQIAPLSPVKDQLKCNSCYVFSATAALEAHNNIVNDIRNPVAEQEIIDCSKENDGCTGGQPYLVYDYVVRNGLAYDNTYPYTGRDGTCKARTSANMRNRFGGLRGYVFPKPGVINLLKALQFGPVAVIMYASQNLKYYSSGIFDGQGCKGNETPNHSALVYGYNMNSPKPYFMVKNGWGSKWGDRGHFKISIGELSNENTGHCFIAKTRYNVMPVMKQ